MSYPVQSPISYAPYRSPQGQPGKNADWGRMQRVSGPTGNLPSTGRSWPQTNPNQRTPQSGYPIFQSPLAGQAGRSMNLPAKLPGQSPGQPAQSQQRGNSWVTPPPSGYQPGSSQPRSGQPNRQLLPGNPASANQTPLPRRLDPETIRRNLPVKSLPKTVNLDLSPAIIRRNPAAEAKLKNFDALVHQPWHFENVLDPFRHIGQRGHFGQDQHEHPNYQPESPEIEKMLQSKGSLVAPVRIHKPLPPIPGVNDKPESPFKPNLAESPNKPTESTASTPGQSSPPAFHPQKTSDAKSAEPEPSRGGKPSDLAGGSVPPKG